MQVCAAVLDSGLRWDLSRNLLRCLALLLLLAHPSQDRPRGADSPAVGQCDGRELSRSGRPEELIAGALAQDRDWAAVCGDDLLIVDPCLSKSFLNAATRMEPWPAVVAVAYEKCRFLGHRSSNGGTATSFPFGGGPTPHPGGLIPLRTGQMTSGLDFRDGGTLIRDGLVDPRAAGGPRLAAL